MIGRFRQNDDDVEQPKGFDDYDLRLGDVMRGERATLGKSLLDVQRELKIKATYIAAIENADPSAFETPGFIAGYVRSYARYLTLDPEWAFNAFCAESGFSTAHGMSQAASAKRSEPKAHESAPFGHRTVTPPRQSVLANIEPGAVGSVVVLMGLIGLLGYGGYAVLNEVQRVQVVPVEQAPEIVADIDPLDSAAPAGPETDDPAQLTAANDAFDRLYRPEALDVPVLVARDGPIAALDPRDSGSFAATGSVDFGRGRSDVQMAADATTGPRDGSRDPSGETEVAALGDGSAEGAPAPVVTGETIPEVVLFAVRPSWVRVRSADGTTIYEQIMQEGDRFVLPRTEEPATLRTGESGAIYFAVNGEHYGPAGAPGQVTGNLALAADTLTAAYEVADLEADTALARVVVELQADPPRLPGQAEADTPDE